MNNEIKNYIGAIKKFAQKMYLESPVVDKDDLIQAGFLGMISGLESFSEEKAKKSGTKKTTYVIRCIHNAILNEANKFYGITALPYNKRLKFNSFKKMYNQNKDKEEIKKNLSVSDKDIEEFISILKFKTISQIESVVEEDNKNFYTLDNLDDIFEPSVFKDYNLSDEDITILKFKLSGLTYTKIAEYYGVARETMRNRVHQIMEKIKNNE